MVTEELYEIHTRDTFRPKLDENLTKEQKWDVIEYLTFLKVKRYRRVKSQTCADVRKNSKKAVPGDNPPPHRIHGVCTNQGKT